MKVAIEGMDGVGKTTVAKELARKNKFLYIEKPLSEIFNLNGSNFLVDISKKIYQMDSEIIKAWFFGMGNLYTFLKYKDENLIIDRHFASNYFWNGTSETNQIFKTMINIIGTPDITIVLYASVETRLKRLHKRNPNDYDLNDKEKHVLGYDKMIEFLDEFKVPYIVINTEGKTEEEVLTEVNSIITSINQNSYTRKLIK